MQRSWQPHVVFLLLLLNCHSAYLFENISLVYKSRCLNGFSCDQTRCLKLSFRCDGKYDCVDRTDELHCDPCKSEQVQCLDGACIQRSSLCDRIKDCSEGEDENPDFCLKQKCPGEFLCRVTLADCVKRPCSDRVLCPDYTDQAEEFCSPVNNTQPSPVKCSQTEFACLNRLQCIHEIYHCDGYRDCEDGSDEFDCDTKQVELFSSNEFVCQGGLSIPKDWVCDQKVDCPMGDDEQVGLTTRSNCTITMFSLETESQSTICPSGTFACGTISTIDKTHCIPTEKVCDGVYDCPDYTDETTDCASPCDEQTQFFCHIAKTDDLRSHDPICISRVEVCDGYPNCPNGDDEATGPRTGCESLNCTIRNGGCSQLCTVIGGRVKCDCHSGYIRSPDNPRVCIAIGEIRILYVDNGQLYGRDLKDTSPSSMLRIKVDPNDLTEQIKWTHTHISQSRSNPLNRMLWSEMGDFDYSLKPSSDGSTLSFIFAHNGEWSGLFGISAKSNTEPKLGSGMLALDSLWTLFVHDSNTSPRIIPHSFTIAFDWVHDLVYWTNGALRTIGVIDRKRGWRKTLAELPAPSQPLGIVVDPRFGRLYWVNRGRTMAIEVMDMDGQNRRSLVTGNLVSPGSLSLDYERNELYWTDGRRGAVEAYDLKKRERRVVIQSTKYYPAWIAVFEDWVYWTDRKVKSLMRANKFTGSNVQNLFHLDNPLSFRIQHDLLRPTWVDRCAQNVCEQLCLPVPLRLTHNYSAPYRCACADDWVAVEHKPNRCRLSNNTQEKNHNETFRRLRIKPSSVNDDMEGKRSPSSALIILLIVVFASCSLGLSVACLGHYTYHKYVHGSAMERAANGSMGSVKLNRKTNSTDLLDVPEQAILNQTNCNV